MKIHIEIDQSNDAFAGGNDRTETQRILHELIRWKLPPQEQGFHEGPVYDRNGNKCGRWKVINK